MHIFLLTETKLYDFKLPQEIFGNYSFGLDNEIDNKIINIEAKDNSWYLYSTKNVSILSENNIVHGVNIEHDRVYYAKYDNKIYIIYARDDEKNELYYYRHNDLDLIIGNGEKYNICTSKIFKNDSKVRIYTENYNTFLEANNTNCYINGNIIENQKTPLLIGDRIWFYGVEIFLLNNHLIINTPNQEISMTELTPAGLIKENINYDKKYIDEELSDLKLYNKEDYFTKSPKIRRTYNKKTINIADYPKLETKEELPVLLTIGPMLTMGMTSMVMLAQTISQLYIGDTTMDKAWAPLLTSAIMMLSTFAWPLLITFYNKTSKKRKYKKDCLEYAIYLDEIEKSLSEEVANQRNILNETIKTTKECLDIISRRNMNFWNKNNNEKDFLEVRLGTGARPLDIEIKLRDEIDYHADVNEQKRKVESAIDKYRYINDAPISFSLKDNPITAVMGEDKRINNMFINNLLVQLLSASNFEDLKIVLFTKQKNIKQWEYLKYLNHCFDNEKTIRYIGVDKNSAEKISSKLLDELKERVSNEQYRSSSNQDNKAFKPHYLIICDEYEMIKETDFMKIFNSNPENVGFSIIISETKLSNLPSNCNNYMNISNNKITLVNNNYDQQDLVEANIELINNLDYMGLAKYLSNIPIEFESKVGSLPNEISFLEMEQVGKVEQLNILDRWKTNDPINSLKAEIGVNNKDELMYLDLHEKYHGPHGLIAGTTGSGKSEFIITYILSMCINYSPDYVSFILIDYKGGGLALAFENKLTGVVLPHLAGTITNLDKAEMNRTLVSIDSESKRRQRLFNEARDRLGESTIDIYKYQKHYKAGRVKEPIPHLFIICDEFAELKAQQPEFMDSLISTARIGRSLGVHLILATQKPSGVVNDQIWSNTKFRICLKVQDEADSQEMLKHKDAAHITKSGRYYLQVGYDEIYELGQSGWCGAKYYPSDEIVKEINNEVDFINSNGEILRSIEENKNVKAEAQGEQLAAIMKNIIEISQHENLSSRKLWLPNIPEVITLGQIMKKYNFTKKPNILSIPIGEYDAPEQQKQGMVEYNFIEDGNTIIYSMNNSDYEMLLEAIIYSTIALYSSDEVNIYGIDFGSEFTKKFLKAPHIGGFAYAGDKDKIINLLKIIKEQIDKRKEKFAEYGGNYLNYIKSGKTDCPFLLIVLNNYDSIYENNQDFYDILPELTRDTVRYGIGFIISCTALNSLGGRSSQNFANYYVFKVKDQFDYGTILNSKSKSVPRDNKGRGMLNNGEMHEFQVLSLVSKEEEYNQYIKNLIEALKKREKTTATPIPYLPKIVTKSFVNNEKITLNTFPLGLSKNSIKTYYYNFVENGNFIVLTKKLKNISNFVLSVIDNVKEIEQINYKIIDFTQSLEIENEQIIKDEFDDNITKIIENIEKEETTNPNLIIIYGFDEVMNKMTDMEQLSSLAKVLQNKPNASVIAFANVGKMGDLAYESGYRDLLGGVPGLFIGKGIGEQSILKIDGYSKELETPIKDDFGFVVQDGEYILLKLIDYYTKDDEDE